MKLLITGAFTSDKTQLNEIAKLGHDVVFMQNESDPLPIGAAEIEGVICNGLFLHHKIGQFCSLKYIQLTSAGFDRVPMDYVKEHNIKIFNARGVYSVPMAEFALCGVLQLYKKSEFFSKNQKAHNWEKQRNVLELFGKTVCIVGCGSVGTECAKRFAALGCKIMGVDICPYENDSFEKIYPLDEIDRVLPECDVVLLTLPLTESTKHLFCAQRLAKIKRGAVLVNIARGAVVETNALIAALGDNLGGAVLDVFETEPLDNNSPLWDMENVIITPHNSFVGDGNKKRLWNVIFSNLKGSETND